MLTQSTAGRSRSRSRSRSIKRSRSQRATTMLPRRILRYDGEARVARSCNMVLLTADNAGISLGASTYAEVMFTYSPLGVTCWGSNVNYQFQTLPNVSEISALWDRVKIEKVELTITGDVIDHLAGSALQAHSAPEIYIGNDVNGPASGATSSYDMVLQESSAKKYKLNSNLGEVKWVVRNPKYQRLIQYTSINSSYEPANGFVQADTDIPHYGTRMAIANYPSVGRTRISVSCKFFFHCKNLK